MTAVEALTFDLASSGATQICGLGHRAFAKPDFDLLSLLKDNPDAGHNWIQRESEAILKETSSASTVFYRLLGCDPAHTSPMEYGGFFVPAEAAILEKITAERVVWVESAPETYFDFLADIPCDLFGWDTHAGPSVAEMREIRSDKLLADSDEADVRLD